MNGFLSAHASKLSGGLARAYKATQPASVEVSLDCLEITFGLRRARTKSRSWASIFHCDFFVFSFSL
jgi:hypothetical protein